MTFRTPTLAAATALLAGCAPMSRHSGERAAAIAAAQPVGDPVSCVSTPAIAATRVLDDQTIEFRMRNGDVYLNRLPSRCSGLGFNEGFSYRSSVSRLCSVDLINVLDRGSGMAGPTCGLGQFQRIAARIR